MRIGLQIPVFQWPGGPAQIGAALARIAREAEAAGFYSLWVMDHFYQIRYFGPPEDPMLEGYTTLGYLAAATRRIKLGMMVTGVTYREPGILVKTVTTLDVVSGGRAYFGVGAAWNEGEHTGLGVRFPPLKERFELLEDTLQLAHRMWAGEDAPFAGTHVHTGRTLNSPQVISRPHPPILIGGEGEQKTLRFVAKYGDACNLSLDLGEATLHHKLDVLREHCTALSRPYADIEKTTLDSIQVAADGRQGALAGPALVDYVGRAAALGFDQAIFSIANVTEPGVFDEIAKVAAQIAVIPPGGRQ